MHSHENTTRLMPDVAAQAQPHLTGALDWVGMDNIEVPVHFDAGDGEVQRCMAARGCRRADTACQARPGTPTRAPMASGSASA